MICPILSFTGTLGSGHFPDVIIVVINCVASPSKEVQTYVRGTQYIFSSKYIMRCYTFFISLRLNYLPVIYTLCVNLF